MVPVGFRLACDDIVSAPALLHAHHIALTVLKDSSSVKDTLLDSNSICRHLVWFAGQQPTNLVTNGQWAAVAQVPLELGILQIAL